MIVPFLRTVAKCTILAIFKRAALDFTEGVCDAVALTQRLII